ncbi:gliding motility-associated-like protein [Algoriphagus sp. 4150]|uniref:PKD domain-containing protein n=1 Tax=Algoriphagus sp. 4150 TaxID=2817756 RepID=UPI0028585472|nr:PKD domain-containing protein [Algoriphagus sp. 4150]MDR7130540.1 gliding motility-associated-like protein [Algoriphagus sp. 4150]
MIQAAKRHSFTECISTFLWISTTLLLLLPGFSNGQGVQISREGFPYCEPFTQSAAEGLRPETIFNTIPDNDATWIAGNAFRLTDNGMEKSGAMYIDIPFSIKYGIQVSFEYYSYGGTSYDPDPASPTYVPDKGADGFVFFMFDADYGDPANGSPNEFKVGGFGGSIGYSPLIQNATNIPGLSGAYMGIAFDEWGRFITRSQGRGSGFENNTGIAAPAPEPNGNYFQNIVIRGPHNAAPFPYPFLGNWNAPTGGVYGVAQGDYFVKTDIAPFNFNIDAFDRNTRITDCLDPDYRKVYLDIQPVIVGGVPSGNYTITLWVRTGTEYHQIFNNLPYNFPAPGDIKIGFSAATGWNSNFHEIANLAVNVSTKDENVVPDVSPSDTRICIGETAEIDIPIDLRSSDLAFIQCIQLYETTEYDINDPTKPWMFRPSPNFLEEYLDCGIAQICDVCNNGRTMIETDLGEFEVILEDLDRDDFEKEEEIRVKFTHTSGLPGTTQIYYTVTDNFGFTSDLGVITVEINPIPEFKGDPEIGDPTCDGQNDGSIGQTVSKLIDGFDYRWKFYPLGQDLTGVDFINDSGNSLPSEIEDIAGPLQADSVRFSLNNVNLGQYVLVIGNPTTSGDFCYTALDAIVVDVETGTPVTVEDNDRIICEGETVSFTPEVDEQYLSNGVTPVFNWYADAQKNDLIISSSDAASVERDGATYSTQSDGTLTIENLSPNADGSPKIYEFFTELREDRNPGQNLCSMIGDLEVGATVTAYAAVEPNEPIIVQDWCLDNTGSIAIVFQRGNEPITRYELLDGTVPDGEPEVIIRPEQSSGVFEGLSKGLYIVRAIADNPTCEAYYPFEIEGPDEELELEVTELIDPTCEVDSGSITWEVKGGNGDYSIVDLEGHPDLSIADVVRNGDGFTFTVSPLPSQVEPYSLTLTVRDSNRDDKLCTVVSSETITPQILPVFSLEDISVCADDTIQISVSVDAGNPDLPADFKWYSDEDATQEIGGTNTNPWDITFTVDPATGTLTAADFPESPDQEEYIVYFRPSIDPTDPDNPVICELPILPATITVNPLPIIEIVRSQSASCFGGSDGFIEVGVTNGNAADFEYMLVGITGYQSSPVFDSGITEGDYTIRVRNLSTGCEGTEELTLTDPEELVFTILDSTGPSCNLDNGTILFEVSGGTPLDEGGYTITINGNALSTYDFTETSPNSFLVENLPGDNYVILIEDKNSCPAQDSRDLVAQILPEYSLEDEEICLNESHTFIPSIDNPGTPDAAPVFRWYKDENAAEADEILSGEDTDLGMTFVVDANTGQLEVSSITNAGAYTFYLKPDILNDCPLEPIAVTLTVSPIPEADFEPVSPLCFGEATGSLLLTSGGSSDYSYELVGNPTSFTSASNSFEGLAAGTYTILITNKLSGCSVEIDRTIEPTPELLIVLLSADDPTCGAPNGEISFEVEGGTPDYVITVNGAPLSDFDMSEAESVYTITNLAPDTYDIKVVDENGCEKSLPTITLTNNDGIEIDVSPTDLEICAGTEAVLRPDIDAPAGAPIAIRWYKNPNYTDEILDGTQDGQISFTILQDYSLSVGGLTPGDFTYYARVGGTNICAVDSESSVKILDKIEASLDPSPIVCFGDSNGQLLVQNVSGGSGTFEFSINGTAWQTESLFEGLSAGNYTLIIRDTNGLSSCTFTEDFTIEGPAGPIEMAPNVPIPASCGEDNGEIMNVVISGGWGDYTHQWTKDSPTGTPITGPITGIKNLAEGVYFLTVTDAEGCTEVFDFKIEIAPDPVYVINPVSDECFGEQISLEAVHTPGDPNAPVARTNVTWYKGSGKSGLISDGVDPANSNITYTIVVDPDNWVNSTLEIDGLPAGKYTYYLVVECTDVELSVSFEVFDFPVLTFTGEKESCYGAADGKIILGGTAEAGMSFRIGNTTYNAADLAAAEFAPGTYTITAQGAACAQSFTVTIDPAIELKGDLVDSKNAACGLTDGYLSFEWEGGQPPYVLTLTPATGSELTHTTSDTKYTFDNLGQGSYTFTVRDDENCIFSLADPITVADGPTEIIVDPAYSSCDGNPISISPRVNPANSNAVFSWYRGTVSAANKISDGEVIDGVTFTLNAQGNLSMAGITVDNAPFELRVTVAGDGVCPGDEKKVDIGVFGNPRVQVNPIHELCFGEGGSLELNVPAGQALEFSLNGGAYQSYPNGIIGGLAPGTYKLEAQNSSGCVVEVGTFTINGPAAPLELRASAIGASCLSPNGMIIGTISGGTPPYTVEAVGDAGPVPASDISLNGNNFTIENQPLGSYEVRVKDANQCEEIEPALTITNEPLEVHADDLTICEGEVAELTPGVKTGQGNGLSYTWFKDSEGLDPISVGTSTDGDLTYEVDSRGKLTITGLTLSDSPVTYFAELDINRPCGRKLAPAVVTVLTPPNLSTRNPSLVCDPTQTVDLSLYIDGFDPANYDYEVLDEKDNQMRMEDIKRISETGTYKVRMKHKNSKCYSATDRILVRISEAELVAKFDYEVEVVAGQPVTNQQVGIGDEVQFVDRSEGNPVRWEWDFGDGTTSTEANPTHVFNDIGTYLIILKTWDDLGCESVVVRELEISDDFDIIFPNAFTPDRGDGKNNYFFPKFRGLASLKVYVFTTWGELIYESSSLEDKGWDGTFRDTPAKNGNYVYRGKYVSRGGFAGETSGVFILIR